LQKTPWMGTAAGGALTKFGEILAGPEQFAGGAACMETAHLWCGGYDIKTPKRLASTIGPE